jgi:hypothetical protein
MSSCHRAWKKGQVEVGVPKFVLCSMLFTVTLSMLTMLPSCPQFGLGGTGIHLNPRKAPGTTGDALFVASRGIEAIYIFGIHVVAWLNSSMLIHLCFNREDGFQILTRRFRQLTM